MPAQLVKRCWGCAQNTPGGTCISLLPVQGARDWQLWAVGDLDGPMFPPRKAIFVLLVCKLFRRRTIVSYDFMVPSAAHLSMLSEHEQ